MAEESIQIRTLTGESITLHITPTATIEDLKLLLNQSFSPATNSPNFHLFFKGEKLKLQARIGSYPIQSGEFLVLIPFTKKESTRTEQTAPFHAPSNASTSNLADSTWSNIMEDLSHFRDTTESDENGSNSVFGTVASEPRKDRVLEGETKVDFLGLEKQIELPYHLILNTLRDTSEGGLDNGEHNCKVFKKVLESVNCLSDLPFGHCKLLKIARLKGVCVKYGVTCLCPPWLKIVIKAFAFINIFSGFLHLQGRSVTTCLLEEALNQLAMFGVKLGLHDMKNLSLLCPHLVCFVDDTEKASFGDVIVVVNHSTSNTDQIEDNPKRAHKWLIVSKIVSTLKRKDSSFRKNLGWAFEQLPVFFFQH